MARLGQGRGYVHAHDTEEGVAAMESLPAELARRRYYRPTDRGYERTMRERLADIAARRRRAERRRQQAPAPHGADPGTE
jgi:putative ATPase